MSARFFLFAALLACGASAAAEPWAQMPGIKMEPVQATPVAADLEAGKKLYQRYCTQCHGDEGKGDGPAADLLYPRPRDFTMAIFKVRTTLSGQLPTDHDLFRSISDGLTGTAMPAWKKYLTEQERWQLVHYVKSLDAFGFFKEEPPKQHIVVGEPPKITPELEARGKQLYQDKKCWQCHGQLGRGDGVSAAGLKDEWGNAILPVNFTKSWRFRGGDRIEDIYRTFTTGVNGTPMPSFADAIPAEADRWALAAYVKSLSRPQQTGQVLKAQYTEGEIPSDPYAAEWEKAELIDFPLAGQIIQKPRWFKPFHDVVTAKALYNGKEAAVMLIWDDGTHDTGADGKLADQVEVQFPTEDKLDGEKPYFIMGDRKHPVDIWRWNAAQGAARLTASGSDSIASTGLGGLAAADSYKDGQYRIILRRPLAPTTANQPTLDAGRFVPVAFRLWNGSHGEEGMKMALSTWFDLLLQPKTPVTVYLWPAGLGILALFGEFWLARRMRRPKGKAVKPVGEVLEGTA